MSGAQSQLAEIETNIDLAAYEPATVRPSTAWLAVRRSAADEIGALGGPLLLSADNEARTSAQIAERLEALAGRFAASETQAPTPLTDQQVEWSTSPLFPVIDTGLRRLEQAPI